MFDENINSENGIKRKYLQNVINTRPYEASKCLKLREIGASVKIKNKHLDRKIRRCYPRGPAWLKIAILDHAVGRPVEWTILFKTLRKGNRHFKDGERY